MARRIEVTPVVLWDTLFEFKCKCGCMAEFQSGEMEPCANGEWVKRDDYMLLCSALEHALRKIEEAQDMDLYPHAINIGPLRYVLASAKAGLKGCDDA